MNCAKSTKRKAEEFHCVCKLDLDDGFSITCNTCFFRSHAICFGYPQGDGVPEEWKCHICDPRPANSTHNRATNVKGSKVQGLSAFEFAKRPRLLSPADEPETNKTVSPTPVSTPSQIFHDPGDPNVGGANGPRNRNKNKVGFMTSWNDYPEEYAQTPESSSKPPKPYARIDAITGGFFTNSRNVVLNNPIMYDINNTKDPVLQWLADSGYLMRGAEFDSDLRDSPPRCHPGTRLDLLNRTLEWFDNPEREQRSLWLQGPAAVGKSAIMQTFAEKLFAKNLGASLFFSRPNGRTNPLFVFPTLAYQLAVRIPCYRSYLHCKMTGDPKILEKAMDHQFRILIAEPFSEDIRGVVGTLAVVIDGLDECEGQSEQIRIIDLICEFIRRTPKSSLVWVIASRPESHLTAALRTRNMSDVVLELDVPVDSDQACHDVGKFLRAQFKEISKRYPDDIPFGAQWPVEHDVTTICKASSGHFGFASTLARFIGDENASNPIGQLAIVLSITEYPHIDPLASLHHLYTNILDCVPKTLLPPLKLLLASQLTVGRTFGSILYPLVSAATLLNLEQHTVYAALRRLHSVIQVPSIQSSGQRNIHFYHASFTDFLCDVSKSRDYALDATDSYTKLWKSCAAFATTYFSNSEPDPPVKWAWHISPGLSLQVKRGLRRISIHNFIHHLMPKKLQCCKALPHVRILLTESDFQNAFETINFRHFHFFRGAIATGLLADFYYWLLREVPVVLRHLKLVTDVGIDEFDLAHIASGELAIRAYTYSISTDSQTTFYSDGRNMPSGSGILAALEEMMKLVCLLEELRESNPRLRVVIFGKAPSHSVALIHYVEPAGFSVERTVLYLIPYSHRPDKIL